MSSVQDPFNYDAQVCEVYQEPKFLTCGPKWQTCSLDFKNGQFRVHFLDSSSKKKQLRKIIIPLDRLVELRMGIMTDTLLDECRSDIDSSTAEQYYSLIYLSKNESLVGKSLNFKSSKFIDLQLLQKWIQSIEDFGKNKKKKINNLKEFCIRNKKKFIQFSEVLNFFDSMKINHEKPTIRVFSEIPEEYLGEYVEAFEINCLDYIFYQYAINGLISAEQLKRFFKIEQNQDEELECCRKIAGEGLNLKDFRKFLCEDDENFSLIDRKCLNVWQDMTHPMNHYFISSSHNTYLTGNQINSKSSYEVYRTVLLDNCRCVEIDVWNGEIDGKKAPVVFHGTQNLTLTTIISLETVLKVINKYAFTNTKYPLILSIENHLDKQNQAAMAEMMRSIFKEKLHLEEPDSNLDNFPSPEEMEYKIFVKGSKNKKSEDKKEEQSSSNKCFLYVMSFFKETKKEFNYFEEDCNADYANYDDMPMTPNTAHVTEQKFDYPAENLENDSQENQLSSESSSQTRIASSFKSPELTIDPAFSNLITFFQTAKFKSLEEMRDDQKFYEMCSLTVKKSLQLIRQEKFEKLPLYREITARNMVRVYPTPVNFQNQFFSANYYPIDHWDAGVQMVALNYQTNQHMLFNSALFQINGLCGYVLKPEYLRNSKVDAPTNAIQKILSIRVIGAILLNVLKPDEKVKLNVVTRVYVPHKATRLDLGRMWPTRQVFNNGYTPLWNETFEFELNNPDLSIVQFILLNDNQMVGQYTIAFTAMKTGIRRFHFQDQSKCTMPNAKLFVQIRHLKPRKPKPF